MDRTCESMTRDELLAQVRLQDWLIRRLTEEVERLLERSEAARKAKWARWVRKCGRITTTTTRGVR